MIPGIQLEEDTLVAPERMPQHEGQDMEATWYNLIGVTLFLLSEYSFIVKNLVSFLVTFPAVTTGDIPKNIICYPVTHSQKSTFSLRFVKILLIFWNSTMINVALV